MTTKDETQWLTLQAKIDIGRAAMSAFFDNDSRNLSGQLEALIGRCINLTIDAIKQAQQAQEPVAYDHPDVRELRKWLNEGQSSEIDRQTLARVLAMFMQPAPKQAEPNPCHQTGVCVRSGIYVEAPKQEPSEAKLGWLRYEKLRKLSPQQFSALYQRNLHGEFFDSLVDSLPEPSTLKPWARGTEPCPTSILQEDSDLDTLALKRELELIDRKAGPTMYIRKDHLEKAKHAGFLCHVTPSLDGLNADGYVAVQAGPAVKESLTDQGAPCEKRKLYECTGCGHLHGEKPSSCDCGENPGNDYNDWTASPTPPEAA